MTTSASDYHRTRLSFDRQRDAVWQEISRFLQERYIPADARILEIGAGYCGFINHVAGREKHALDRSEIILEHAAADVLTHVRPCIAMEQFGGDAFDVAFASNLFEHLNRDELAQTLAELRRVLRPGGRLIVVQPNFRYCYRVYFDDYTHVQVFTHVSLPDLLAASGFGVSDITPRFLPFSMKSRLPKSRLLVRWYLRSPYKPLAGQMLVVAENRK